MAPPLVGDAPPLPASPLVAANGERRCEVVLDLDNCCYPKSSGVGPLLRDNIVRYGIDRFGLTEDHAEAITRKGWKEHGLSVIGYVNECGMDNIGDFMHYIHTEGMRYRELGVHENERLVARVRDFGKVWLLTNGTHTHAEKCLTAIGFDVEKDFGDGAERIISCYEQWGLERPEPSGAPVPIPAVWTNKPHEAAYLKALEHLDTSLPIVFADDVHKNLEVPRSMGWVTVLVDEHYDLGDAGYRHNPPEYPAAHYVVRHVEEVFDLPLLRCCVHSPLYHPDNGDALFEPSGQDAAAK